ELVPEDALGFILVKDLRQLSDNVENLATKLKAPERVSLLELIQTGLGIRKGLNENGSAIFIFPKWKTAPAIGDTLSARPAADYEEILGQAGAQAGKDGISEGGLGVWSGLYAKVATKDSQEKTQRADGKKPVLLAKKGDFALLAMPGNREG